MSPSPADRSAAVELRHLRLVAAIAAHGSLTAAARALHITQPAASLQLRDIETRLRTPLFVRTPRRLEPTAAGERILRLARGVLAEVESFERQVAGGAFANVSGAVRLATECYTSFHWLPGVLKVFRERWPGIDVRIAPEHTNYPALALRDGLLDVALLHRNPRDRRLRLERLFDDELVVIMAPDHRLARRTHVAASEFAREHLILYGGSADAPSMVQEVLDAAGVVPARLTRIQLTEAITELVAAGLGVGVLARWAVAPLVRAGTLAAVRFTPRGCPRTWFMAVRADDPAPAYLLDLRDLLRTSLAGGPVVRPQAVPATAGRTSAQRGSIG
ncbi:MAG: LysR family transcriptional regulator [Gemmatimonadetes bacterium]|nr:LysR family transcriptional regulator [Gemmatimonadota bacterium]